MNLNPKAAVVMWTFTLLMAGAITLGSLAIYIVGGLLTAYTLYAIYG